MRASDVVAAADDRVVLTASGSTSTQGNRSLAPAPGVTPAPTEGTSYRFLERRHHRARARRPGRDEGRAAGVARRAQPDGDPRRQRRPQRGRPRPDARRASPPRPRRPRGLPIDRQAAALIEPDVARRFGAVPIAFLPDGTVVAALYDPNGSTAVLEFAHADPARHPAGRRVALADRGADGDAAARAAHRPPDGAGRARRPAARAQLYSVPAGDMVVPPSQHPADFARPYAAPPPAFAPPAAPLPPAPPVAAAVASPRPRRRRRRPRRRSPSRNGHVDAGLQRAELAERRLVEAEERLRAAEEQARQSEARAVASEAARRARPPRSASRPPRSASRQPRSAPRPRRSCAAPPRRAPKDCRPPPTPPTTRSRSSSRPPRSSSARPRAAGRRSRRCAPSSRPSARAAASSSCSCATRRRRSSSWRCRRASTSSSAISPTGPPLRPRRPSPQPSSRPRPRRPEPVAYARPRARTRASCAPAPEPVAFVAPPAPEPVAFVAARRRPSPSPRRRRGAGPGERCRIRTARRRAWRRSWTSWAIRAHTCRLSRRCRRRRLPCAIRATRRRRAACDG